MSTNDDLLEILIEALGRTGAVVGRRMFGGIGVYFEGTFFALIDDGTIYFKASSETVPKFEVEGSQPFTYQTKRGSGTLATYWRLPERLLDDPDEMYDWAIAAIEVATAVRASKRLKPIKAKAAVSRKKSKPRKRPGA